MIEQLSPLVGLHSGDCVAFMASQPENSFDAICCDPPYHLTSIVKRFGGENAAPVIAGKTGVYARSSAGFMGKAWDGGDIAFQAATWEAALRVLKPGGYLLAFGGARGFARMSVAIQDAGFIEHPMIAWLFAQGFPKATAVKAPGYEGVKYGGQSLKPAFEPIFMGQKPFSEKTGTANILKWGTGGVNIDACRVAADDAEKLAKNWDRVSVCDIRGGKSVGGKSGGIANTFSGSSLGRWPANLLHDGSDEALVGFPEIDGRLPRHQFNKGKPASASKGREYERIDFHPGIDGGNASRYFFSSKAGSQDRCGSLHPTIKPVSLMRYLVRLVTPPGGRILDPFAGSGTTGQAAALEGLSAVLCEMEPQYQADIRRRIDMMKMGNDEKRVVAIKARGRADDHAGPLFGEVVA